MLKVFPRRGTVLSKGYYYCPVESYKGRHPYHKFALRARV